MVEKAKGSVGRPFEFPDPDDRSPNEPIFTAQPNQVLGIYNRANKEKMQKVTKAVREWFEEEAKKQNWESIRFSGSECILENTTVESCKKNDK